MKPFEIFATCSSCDQSHDPDDMAEAYCKPCAEIVEADRKKLERALYMLDAAARSVLANINELGTVDGEAIHHLEQAVLNARPLLVPG